MNHTRRREIRKIIEDIAALPSRIEAVAADEQEYMDNMPDNLGGSEKYDAAQAAIDVLNEAAELMTDAFTGEAAIDDVVDKLQEAV